MENQKLVSVIMPVYNTEEYLAENIESILNQDYQNIELLLVDDGSSDQSPHIMETYAKQDQRVKNLYQKNSGAPTARNKGLAAAEGFYIYFVDSDDKMASHAISKLVESAERTGADIVMGQFDIVDEKSRFLKKETLKLEPGLHQVETMRKEISFLPPMPGNKLLRKSLLTDYAIVFEPDLRQAQDLNFYLKMLAHAKQIAIVPYTVYHYRIRLGSISHTYSLSVLDTIKSLDQAEAYYRKQGMDETKLFTNIKYAHFTTKFQKVPQMKNPKDRQIALQTFKKGFKGLDKALLYEENLGRKYFINTLKFMFGNVYTSQYYTNYQDNKAKKNNPYKENDQ